mmetsp:Transcript_14005/g.30439  ORF Transcript_14005/g.30439 Transcript_14005/m.30439 type:complete len:254 (-) Transcript_14005:24-785(-)
MSAGHEQGPVPQLGMPELQGPRHAGQRRQNVGLHNLELPGLYLAHQAGHLLEPIQRSRGKKARLLCPHREGNHPGEDAEGLRIRQRFLARAQEKGLGSWSFNALGSGRREHRCVSRVAPNTRPRWIHDAECQGSNTYGRDLDTSRWPGFHPSTNRPDTNSSRGWSPHTCACSSQPPQTTRSSTSSRLFSSRRNASNSEPGGDSGSDAVSTTSSRSRSRRRLRGRLQRRDCRRVRVRFVYLQREGCEMSGLRKL